MFDAAETLPARGQHYSVGVARVFVTLTTHLGVSLRGAAGVMAEFANVLGLSEGSPVWTTARCWLLRIGLAALRRPLEKSKDWVWLADHSVQIGTCKCLVILGIQLSRLPKDRPLLHEDMELIALEPMRESTKVTVYEQLEAAVPRTGSPRAILTDHGADLHGGIQLFQAEHPETIELYDIKHKAACLLKARMNADERWSRFATLAAQSKASIQQTDLAALSSPSQRSKSRFMNLYPLVEWGQRVLAALDHPELLPTGMIPEKLREKLGWIEEYRAPLAEWSACHKVIAHTLEFVRQHGLFVGAGRELAATMPMPPVVAPESVVVAPLRDGLVAFVTEQSAQLRPGERAPGTTEVLESSFGKLKSLERDHSKSGFTGLVLALGASVGHLDSARIKDALERCPFKEVLTWIKTKLGATVQSQRCQLAGRLKSATETG